MVQEPNMDVGIPKFATITEPSWKTGQPLHEMLEEQDLQFEKEEGQEDLISLYSSTLRGTSQMDYEVLAGFSKSSLFLIALQHSSESLDGKLLSLKLPRFSPKVRGDKLSVKQPALSRIPKLKTSHQQSSQGKWMLRKKRPRRKLTNQKRRKG